MLNVYEVKIAHPDVFQQIPVGENLIVYYKCPQTENRISLYNSHDEVLFTISGKKTIHFGNEIWDLTDDDALLVRKTGYVQERDPNLEWKVIAFHFNTDFLKSVVKEFKAHFAVEEIPEVPRDMVLRIHVNPNIQTGFLALLPLFSDSIQHSEHLLERKVKELLIDILAEPRNMKILAYFNHVYLQNKVPIDHVMESNFMFNLPLGEFAKISHRSLSTFKHDFKEHYKTSPGKWLHQRRLSHAKYLLSTTSSNISEVAYQSGFKNLSHFSREFKKEFGCSPSDFVPAGK